MEIDLNISTLCELELMSTLRRIGNETETRLHYFHVRNHHHYPRRSSAEQTLKTPQTRLGKIQMFPHLHPLMITFMCRRCLSSFPHRHQMVDFSANNHHPQKSLGERKSKLNLFFFFIIPKPFFFLFFVQYSYDSSDLSEIFVHFSQLKPSTYLAMPTVRSSIEKFSGK